MGIASSTLSTIQKNKEKIITTREENVQQKKKRLRTSNKEDLDSALLKWFQQQRNANIPISGPILQEKATQFGRSLGYGEDFICSMGFINRWKVRHNIVQGKISGEAKSVEHFTVEDCMVPN
jgi:hypothetical protein